MGSKAIFDNMENKETVINNKGLIMVHTGNGKGKTTAALGLAFRSLGHGLPVCVIQFIKGNGWKYGELKSAERFKDLLDWHVVGDGFIWEGDDKSCHQKAAIAGWGLAQTVIEKGMHHLVILDEFTYVLKYMIVEESDAIETLLHKPQGLNVLITGRDAPQSIIGIADLVTEMIEVEHPFSKGIKAQKGMEF